MSSEDAPSGGHQPGLVRILGESLALVVIAIVLALVVQTFLVQAFFIPSESMEPGLRIDDRILVEKPSYWMSGTPRRGDVVVFEDPGDWLGKEGDHSPAGLRKMLATVGLYPSGGHLVKRVIGVGGDTVACCDQAGRITVNGHPLEESSYVATGLRCDGPMDQQDGAAPGGCRGWTARVPEGRLFVMGDNRASSADSSFHLCTPQAQRRARQDAALARRCAEAFVPEDLVVGKVVALVWPLSHVRTLHRPSTFADVPERRG